MKEERVPFKDKSLNQRLKNYITKKERAFFLHPNVPLEVINELFESKNSALRLGLVIIYRSILENKTTLKLSRNVLEEFKISKSYTKLPTKRKEQNIKNFLIDKLILKFAKNHRIHKI